MSSYNLVVLLGHTCRDVDLRFTPRGTAVGNFSMAVNRKWKNESGDLMEEVAFIDCTVWGKTAETMAQHVLKGHAVHLQGRLATESWEDKTTGQKRSKLKVIVESFQFLNQRGGDSADEPSSARQPRQTTTARPAPAQDDANRLPQDDDDGVPF